MKFLGLADWAFIMIVFFGVISWNFNGLFFGVVSFILFRTLNYIALSL